jgi:hypothetical protein
VHTSVRNHRWRALTGTCSMPERPSCFEKPSMMYACKPCRLAGTSDTALPGHTVSLTHPSKLPKLSCCICNRVCWIASLTSAVVFCMLYCHCCTATAVLPLLYCHCCTAIAVGVGLIPRLPAAVCCVPGGCSCGSDGQLSTCPPQAPCP